VETTRRRCATCGRHWVAALGRLVQDRRMLEDGYVLEGVSTAVTDA
jgi:hypothetical protein